MIFTVIFMIFIVFVHFFSNKAQKQEFDFVPFSNENKPIWYNFLIEVSQNVCSLPSADSSRAVVIYWQKYRKFPKYSDTQKIDCNHHSKICTVLRYRE